MTDRDMLIEMAKVVSESAYCPYSKFKAGCALMCHDGAVYIGCNVENAAYGDTISAERNAITTMIANGNRSGIKAIAVYTDTDKAAWPCGSCRQIINEFGCGQTLVHSGSRSRPCTLPLYDLLPHSFGPEDLQDEPS
jgi:cytidine deaminase